MKYTRLVLGCFGVSIFASIALACSDDSGDGDGSSSGGSSSSSSSSSGGSSSSSGGSSSSSGGSSSSSSGGSSSSSGGSSGASSSSGGSNVAECEEIKTALDTLSGKRGTCAETTENQEPLAFVLATCNTSYATACTGAGTQEAVDTYLSCLGLAPSCAPGTTEDAYNDSIDDCTDGLQNDTDVSEACLEVVIGD